MRTFVRFLAFLAVFASGVLLVVSGTMWIDSVQPPPRWQQAPVVEEAQREATPQVPPSTPQSLTPPPPTRVKVFTGGTTELFDGDLYISVPKYSETLQSVNVTIGAPGLLSKTYDMHIGDVAFYQGKRAYEIRLESLSFRAETIATTTGHSFLVREVQSSAEAPTTVDLRAVLERLRSEQGPIPGYGLPQAPEYGQTVSGVLSVVMGLVLMVSATVLVAVRPKVRPSPPRAIAAAAKPSTAQPPSAPVTLDLGPQEAPQSVSATFQTGTGRDGSLWRKVTGLHWRLIQPGWTEQQVRRLLGGPIKVRPAKATTGEAVSIWHYYSGVFRVSSSKGTVTFKDGKVVGFAAPPMDYARWVAHTPNPEA